MAELTSGMIKELKAAAHSLSPIINVGKQGLTQTVFAEIDKHLQKRELIKIKVLKTVLETMTKDEVKSLVESNLNCSVLAYIGNVLILYRAHGEND